MINNKYLLGLSFFFLTSGTNAVTKQTEIEMSYTHTPYVKLIGTAPGSNRVFDNNDIANWIYPVNVDLGTMGLDSNIPGDCDVNFTTLNNFNLKHTVSGSSLTSFEVLYRSEVFGTATNETLTMPCTSVPTSIQFKATGIVFGNIWEAYLIQSGTYSDTVNVVVTTQ